ncbi:MAG: large conductance mechanosensitive channel protein MscL [Propionibacteriaceae bacterium]|jgi:large conductance mechanosensitive channel|nr:large conductance mechanosensitive channel protein MscL [Propionibacteriaceae bacterium]
MLKGFKEFISRGSAVDLAVGVVIGAAFTGVVNAVVNGFVNPLLGALVGKPNFDSFLEFTLNGSTVQIGQAITAIVQFLLTAAAIYFCVVYPLNKLASLRKPAPEPAAETPADVLLLAEIRDLLKARS